MAIRSGTGGLKYPLPAAPDAQQSIAAASSGGSAAASAFGANRAFAANKMRVQADLANSAADRNYRAQAQIAGQNFEAQQNYYDRENRKGAQLEAQRFDAERQEAMFGQQKELQQAGQQFSASQAELERGFTTERDKARFEQDQAAYERDVDADVQARIRSGELELSPEAQMRLQKIEADRAALAAQNNLTPEQKAEFEAKAQQQERELIRTARAPRTPTASEQANSRQTFYDPQTGKYETEMQPGRIPGSVGKDGQFQPTVDNSKQQQDQQKQTEDLYKDAQTIAGETNAEGAPVYKDFDAALEEARRRRASAGLPVPGQQQPGAPSTGQQPPPNQPPAPQPTGPSSAGMGDSVRQRSGSDIPGAAGITPDAFTQQWSSLAPGGVMYGPDGKLYTKKK